MNNYELIIRILPKKVLKIIEQIRLEVAPRNALETLLVSAGGKPADKIEWLKTEQIGKFKIRIEQIKEILPYIQSIDDKLGEVIYFNTNLRDLEQVIKVKEIFEKDSKGNWEVGILWGYPSECCIPAEMNNTGMMSLMPGTEHYWCKPDCEESIKIQQNNYKIIKANMPEYKKYLDIWGELGLH